MPASKLVRPSEEYRESFLDALSEYHAEERFLHYSRKQGLAEFEEFVKKLRSAESGNHRPVGDDWAESVPETMLWFVKDETYIGSLDIRHRLNWHLEKWGGHIDFVIRPSMRRQGFGKKILQKAKPFASHLGVDRALLTVEPDNLPAIRIIEVCGGVFEDETPETEKFPARLRYWLECY